MFRKGLKEKIKNKIIHHKYHTILENQINILRKLINMIIKLNNQLYKCRLERNPK